MSFSGGSAVEPAMQESNLIPELKRPWRRKMATTHILGRALHNRGACGLSPQSSRRVRHDLVTIHTIYI